MSRNLGEYTFWKYTFGKYTLDEYTFEKYTLGEYIKIVDEILVWMSAGIVYWDQSVGNFRIWGPSLCPALCCKDGSTPEIKSSGQMNPFDKEVSHLIFYCCQKQTLPQKGHKPLRRWLQFWHWRTWMHDNLCCLTIKSDTGEHLQFLWCFRHVKYRQKWKN